MNDDDHGSELDPTHPDTSKEVYVAPEDQEVEEIQIPVNVEAEAEIFNVHAEQEETRAKIALYFTQSFLILIVICLLAPFFLYLAVPQVVSQPFEGAKELVTLVASVLAGPFGFIVGFYFKQREE